MAKILIVDDSRTTRKILRTILEEEGHQVVAEAKSGEEAVEQYKGFNPELVTMDITMPGLDGLGALRQILEYDPEAKVIMVTAAGQKHKVLEAMKAGAAEFVTKPLKREEIVERLTNILN